jgi:hypothetical protein
MHEVRARKIRRDGIHFQGLRYLSLTLAAYVGEDATIRFDPRDMGEIRVFYKDCLLCRAISAELAGETIPLRDVIRVQSTPKGTAVDPPRPPEDGRHSSATETKACLGGKPCTCPSPDQPHRPHQAIPQ